MNYEQVKAELDAGRIAWWQTWDGKNKRNSLTLVMSIDFNSNFWSFYYQQDGVEQRNHDAFITNADEYWNAYFTLTRGDDWKEVEAQRLARPMYYCPATNDHVCIRDNCIGAICRAMENV